MIVVEDLVGYAGSIDAAFDFVTFCCQLSQCDVNFNTDVLKILKRRL